MTVVRSGSGTVRSVPGGIDCGATCASLYPSGTVVLLSATPSTGWKFAGWAGACGGTSGCSVTVAAETTVWATFEAEAPAPGHHFLSVARAGTGTGHVASSPAGVDCGSSCGAPFEASAVVSLTASADPGSKFSGWTGACAGTAGCSVPMSADRSVTATFDLLPPPDECAALRPADPGPAPDRAFLPFARTTGDETCRPGYVAGSGTLALLKDDPTQGSATTILFTRSAGDPLATATSVRMDLTEQLDGFIAQHTDPTNQTWLSVFDSLGRESGSTQAPGVSGALEDPTGGVVGVQTQVTGLLLQSYDAQLHPRWSIPLPPKAGPLRVDRAGNTLVLWDGTPLYGPGSLAAYWVDHSGTQGPTFELIGPGSGPTPAVTAAARVDSGLFLANGGLWIWQLDTLSTTPVAAPPWLAARPVREMHMVHGGRGYAVLPPPAGDPGGPCAQEIEVIAPSGKSCGTSLFRAADGACRPLAIRVGYDGTVVQQLPSDHEQRCADGVTQCTCTWHWWPGFFR